MPIDQPSPGHAIELTSREITARILSVRGSQVLLDSHLAEMYQVETKALNRAVKRNAARFPESFCFRLTAQEWESVRQNHTPNSPESLRFQSGTLKIPARGQHRKYLPHVFTEQGVAMLSAVLHSPTAVTVSIRIIEAFVEMRRLLLQHAGLFQKVEQIELRQIQHIADSDEKFNRIFNALESPATPASGIFHNGQIFDAYTFAADLIRQAKKSIILVDNYVDDAVLSMLSKRGKSVSATIYTGKIGKQLDLDLRKHNEQYPAIEVHMVSDFHDRFLILDGQTLYHIGASLKDLGKKCFAFSRMDSLAPQILARLLPHPISATRSANPE
jgi:phage regulator Rha-like protein